MKDEMKAMFPSLGFAQDQFLARIQASTIKPNIKDKVSEGESE